MAHLHSIYDCDTHFVIDLKTREIKNDIGKTVIVQNDHNSERFSFELPKEIEGHDMSRCNVVQVHYVNIDAKTKEQHEGSYEVDDLQISPDGDDVVILSWLLSQNATRAVGNLYFGIVFKCIEEDGSLTYSWHTTVNKDFKVVESLENSDVILEEYPDILAQFEARFAALEEEYAEKLNEAANLTESVNQLKNQASTKQETANALQANASGELIRIDDVSPIEHTVKVKASGATDPSAVILYASGKNLFDVKNHGIFDPNITFERNNNEYTVQGAAGNKALAYSAGVFQIKFLKTIKIIDKITVSLYVTLLEKGVYDSRIGVDSNYVVFDLTKGERQKLSITYDSSQPSISAISFYMNNNKVLFELDTLQIEIGDVATEYEEYISTNCKFTADGTAEIASISPTMTLFTDTDGVSIDVEYNQNLNDAIEQLKKEAPNGGGSGGDIADIVSEVTGSANIYPAYSADNWKDNYIFGGGIDAPDENCCYSPLITVKPNTQYTTTHKPYKVTDNHGIEITVEEVFNLETINGIEYRFYTPSNCSQITITIDKREFGGTTDINTAVENFNSVFMLVEGATLPTEFEPYVKGGYRLNENVEVPAIGDKSKLKTKNKNSLVDAINELIENPTFGTESVPDGGGTFPVEKTKLSEFENDVGFITVDDLPENPEIPETPKGNGTYKLNAFIKNNKKVYYWEKTEDSREFYDYETVESGKLSPNDMFYYEKLFTLTQQDGDFYNSLLYSDSGSGTVTIIDPEKWEIVNKYTHDKKELIKPHANSMSIFNVNGVPHMYSNVYNNYASDETDKHIGECCVYRINESFAKDVTDIVFELGSLDSTTGKVLDSTTRKISDFFSTIGLNTILLDKGLMNYSIAICCYDSEQQFLGQLTKDLQSLITGSAQWISATTTASVSISMENLKTINSDIEYVRFILNSASTTPNIMLSYDNVTNDTLVQILKIGFIDNADLWTLTDSRPYGNFITDEENGFLYVYVPNRDTNSVKFHKFNIPSITDGLYNTTYGCNVKILEETDIIESWTIPYYPSYIQGGCYKDNQLWITHGGGTEASGAKMLVIDLTTKTIIATFDLLSAGIVAEPEFAGFYKNECYYGTLTDIYKLSFV